MEALTTTARRFFTEQNFIVLDTETTGKQTWSAEVVEIAILNHLGKPLLNSLVKPTCPIPADMTDIHGITNEMVQDAPTFPELFPQIVSLFKDKTVVVYNRDYDIGLLDSLTERHQLGHWICTSWCLMKAYAAYRKTAGRYGDYKWHKLGDACKQQNVLLLADHRAMPDALATWSLLKKLAEMEGK